VQRIVFLSVGVTSGACAPLQLRGQLAFRRLRQRLSCLHADKCASALLSLATLAPLTFLALLPFLTLLATLAVLALLAALPLLTWLATLAVLTLLAALAFLTWLALLAALAVLLAAILFRHVELLRCGNRLIADTGFRQWACRDRAAMGARAALFEAAPATAARGNVGCCRWLTSPENLMQPTTLGPNLTGASLAPESIEAMQQACAELSAFDIIDTSATDAQKLAFAAEADAVGSVPKPPSIKGLTKSAILTVKGGEPTIFLDKLGERLAYERTGTRLYDALIVKYKAAQQLLPDALPAATGDAADAAAAEPAESTLLRIRNEELSHFRLLSEAIVAMGGDPTSVTPCADVAAVASAGYMQVLNDPRTTLAQCLNAMLAVELADNAGWELLASLADAAGEDELAGRFLGALSEEHQHLAIIKSWLTTIVCAEPEPAVV
jgi:hypothetical protein